MSEPGNSSETLAKGLGVGEDGKIRCWWHGGKDDYRTYHDEEWGMPVDNDIKTV